jgi:hypothetical protein
MKAYKKMRDQKMMALMSKMVPHNTCVAPKTLLTLPTLLIKLILLALLFATNPTYPANKLNHTLYKVDAKITGKKVKNSLQKVTPGHTHTHTHTQRHTKTPSGSRIIGETVVGVVGKVCVCVYLCVCLCVCVLHLLNGTREK